MPVFQTVGDGGKEPLSFDKMITIKKKTDKSSFRKLLLFFLPAITVNSVKV
jgi:hypothetical protein